MKKQFSILLIFALVLALSVPVLAANPKAAVTYDYNGGFRVEVRVSFTRGLWGSSGVSAISTSVVHRHTEPLVDDYCVTEITPSYYGKTLSGWLDEATGHIYKPGDSLNTTEDITLTAVWEKEKEE